MQEYWSDEKNTKKNLFNVFITFILREIVPIVIIIILELSQDSFIKGYYKENCLRRGGLEFIEGILRESVQK